MKRREPRSKFNRSLKIIEQDMLSDRSEAWREDLRKLMSAKERTQLARVEMPELDATYRSGNMTLRIFLMTRKF